MMCIMARWDIYNIIGDTSPLLGYEVESRDWSWEDNVNPTPDVGLAFKTVVRALSEEEQKWTDELLEILGESGGGRLIKYEGSTVDGSVTCHDLRINQNGEQKQVDVWRGKLISIYRIDDTTIYDRGKHDWNEVDEDLTLNAIPYSTRNTSGGRDPDPRFHLPLMKVVEEDTGLQTAYKGEWGHGWRTAGDLPDCVYNLKDIPEHLEKE